MSSKLPETETEFRALTKLPSFTTEDEMLAHWDVQFGETTCRLILHGPNGQAMTEASIFINKLLTTYLEIAKESKK